MKRIATIFLALSLCLAFSACGTGEDSVPTNTGVEFSSPVITNDSQLVEEVSVSPETEALSPLLEIEYIPVASSQERFIVRNESGNLYGLVDSSGNFILPCEYEELSFQQAKSQTVLKVMSKGSYGVSDLDGTELIPCEYTDIIFSQYDDSCIVKTFLGKLGVLTFNNKFIVPAEFDIIKFGFGESIVAVKRSEADTYSATISTYQADGQPIMEIPWDGYIEAILMDGGGGNLVGINWTQWGDRYTNQVYLTLEGEEAVYCDTAATETHLYYMQDGVLVARDIATAHERPIWTFPNASQWNGFKVSNVYEYIDPITDTIFCNLSVTGGTLGTRDMESYDLRISFEDPVAVIDFSEEDIQETIGDASSLGGFYGGVAIAFPPQGYLCTVNTSGEKLSDITNPYTNKAKSILLENAAVLNNNDFYSIVNSDGELLLSEDGYSDVQRVNVSGIYMVTDQNGQLGLINKYAEELVPCGGISSIESAIERPSNDNWALESSMDAEDELYVVHNEDKWAVYSVSEGRLVTDFAEMSGDALEQYNCLLGNSGFALIDEDGQKVYLVSYDGGNYKVYVYCDL